MRSMNLGVPRPGGKAVAAVTNPAWPTRGVKWMAAIMAQASDQSTGSKIRGLATAGIVSVLVFGGGCACFRQPQGTASRPATKAILAAASANQINMFGELPWTSPQAPGLRESISLKQHTFSEVGSDFDPDVDPAGTRLVFASTRHNRNSDIYIKAVDGVALTQLTSDPASDVQPVFSPDGRRLAFASNRSGNWDIWVMDLDGGAPMQVTNSPADELHPSWSPDGQRLAYCALPETGGTWELWISDVHNAATRRFVGFGLFPKWSPSGDKLLFQRARERGGRLFSVWTIDLVNGEPRYPTELAFSATHALTLPTWSRDGQQIAFVSVPDPNLAGNAAADDDRAATTVVDANMTSDIWVTRADGRDQKCLTDGFGGNYAPVFAPDGRLFFVSSRTGRDSIWSLLPLSVSAPGMEPARTTLRPAIRYEDAVRGDDPDTRHARTDAGRRGLPDENLDRRTQAVAENGR